MTTPVRNEPPRSIHYRRIENSDSEEYDFGEGFQRQVPMLVLLLLILLWCGVSSIYDSWANKLMATEGTFIYGRVVKVYTTSGRGGSYWVSYTFDVEEAGDIRSYEGKSSVPESDYQGFAVDQPVEILYARTHPEINCMGYQIACRIKLFRETSFRLVFGISAIIFSILALPAIFFRGRIVRLLFHR